VSVRLEIWAVGGLPEIGAGDDLAALIGAAAPDLADSDVVVVTSKVVSKAEGRLVPGSRDEHLAAESVRQVASRGPMHIVETRHGFVMAAAGIDASNVPAGHVVLLPVDPDASAARIRAGLRDRLGVTVAVVVSDTMGRPWRDGVTDVAIGAAGFDVLEDLRGERDAAGHELEATVVAVADELAAAGDLVKGKLRSTPVAVIRGLTLAPERRGGRGAKAIIRPSQDDMFRLGTREAMSSVVAGSTLVDAVSGRVDEAAVERAVRAVGGDRGVPVEVSDAGRTVTVTGAALPAGVVVGRLLGALAAEGLRAAWAGEDPPTLRIGSPDPR
jgi:coenzyme F420-0:L-glutamate ligase/coenzyme F420-1:gamma-L-glutamate ligase